MCAWSHKKKADVPLRARCDSFVVKTNVHYPTDLTLLYDAIRKIITITANECQKQNIPGWRQYQYMIKRIKRLLRKVQKLKRSNSKRATKKLEKERAIARAYRDYIKLVQKYIERTETMRDRILVGSNPLVWESIQYFIQHANRQIDQITKRVLHGETIPHQEKVFSIFQPHTEWICKGKAGVPVELGLRVAIIEDHHGFLLNHRVMEKQTDDQVVQSLITETKQRFPDLYSCSFDKAFHSLENQQVLNQTLDIVALPRKGRLSKANAKYEQSEAFLAAKKKHSAVESAINALEVHGLDRCPDQGLDGFKCYVALAILSRNLQIIGAILIKREKRRLQRQYRLAA